MRLTRARVHLRAPGVSGARAGREPITIGLPIPRGVCRDAGQVGLADREGRALPIQARTLERWSDGSVRWLLLDFQASIDSDTFVDLHFDQAGGTELDPAGSHEVATARSEGDAVILSSGALALRVGPGARLFAALTEGDRPLIDPALTRLLVRAGGAEIPLVVRSITVEEPGPLRASVLVGARLDPLDLDVTCRLEVFAGLAVARLRMTLHNPRAAQHPGGIWELGDPGSVLLEQVSLEVAPAPDATVTRVSCAVDRRHPMAPVERPFRVHQESSGRPNWASAVHRARTGVTAPRYCGYRATGGTSSEAPPRTVEHDRSGSASLEAASPARLPHPNALDYARRGPRLRRARRLEGRARSLTNAQGLSDFKTSREGTSATPIVSVDTSAGSIAVTSRLFWEVFPKAYAVSDAGVLSIDLLPADRVEDHELQAGERFSHDLALGVGADPAALEWVRTPTTPIVDPMWWAGTGDVSHLGIRTDPQDRYERLVQAAIDGDDTFIAKRDWIDEYGWRHYGDLYADHENGSADAAPIVSHYNNQYDGIAGMLVQLMRSGDPRWWSLANDLAIHVRYIDVYATDRDRIAYNNGLFWHTFHYVDAGRSSHRSYPRAPGVGGGGPAIEHNYSTGLLLHYLMTGDPDSRDAVLRIARWTVDMDDGSRTVLRYLSRGATGLASATGSADYHGPGRGPANAIQTLLNAARLTGDRAWLDKAEELIRRCIHPRDDLEARNLLDAERRWYYTVFLQTLGRYLAFKSERGDEDGMWRYARASLLHYARWMAAHEYPYLDKPEILEYPTETWAAQDMRKCEVFDLASKYAETADERARFVERARYFFGQSVETLHRWPTRTWTRPVVLMLSYGYAHLWHEAHRETLPLLPPAGAADVGEPTRFEPQKTIAIRRTKRLAASLTLAVLGLAGLLALTRF